MKITTSEIIKTGERELIDTIIGDLDWKGIEKIIRDRHKLNIQDDIEYKDGDIIVFDKKVAYRLDFEVKMTLSVVFDREGNCLSLLTSDIADLSEAPDTLNATEADNEEKSMTQSLYEEDVLELTPEIEVKNGGVQKVAVSGISESSDTEGGRSDLEKEMADLLDSSLDIESEKALENDILQLTSELEDISDEGDMEAVTETKRAAFDTKMKDVTDASLQSVSMVSDSVAESDLEFTTNDLADLDAESDDDFLDDAIVDLTESDLIENENALTDEPISAGQALASESKTETAKDSQEKISKMASQIANMISEINEDK